MAPVIYLGIVIFVCLGALDLVSSSNWAQVSGNIGQNTAVPYYPAPNRPHWAARYGHATVNISAENQLEDTTALNMVFVLGGDTYDGDVTSRSQLPGLIDKTWGAGYKNDVWKMTETKWDQRGDPQLRGNYHQKIPKIQAMLNWELVNAGLLPPPGTTYAEFIRCAKLPNNNAVPSDCPETPSDIMWSPRRHHAAVVFNMIDELDNNRKKPYIIVLGGRAREFVELPEERSVGGIIGPRVKDINPDVAGQRFTTQREASIVKSDVWRSKDGYTWELLTPGCRVNQPSLTPGGFPGDGKFGTMEYACASDSDCTVGETCNLVKRTCECKMWSPREQHAVAVYGEYIYVSGGYASRLYDQFSNCGPYACGDTDASAYRYFMSDVWRSKDGQNWEIVTESVTDTWPGRGGHQMLVVHESDGNPYLWVIGGRGGDNTMNGGEEIYYNDMYKSPLAGSNPIKWTRFHGGVPTQGPYMHDHTEIPWSPRTGHGVALEGVTADSKIRTLYLYGGYHKGEFLDDLWAWRLDDPTEFWRRDFTSDAYYSNSDPNPRVDDLVYYNNSPSKYYVTPDSPLSMLQRFFVPDVPPKGQGLPLEPRVYLSADKVKIMAEVGLHTIRDLAEIDLYTVLKLRGFDYPQVPMDQRYDLHDICDYRALAMALVDKCTLTLPSLYDGERNQPWNIIPVFGGPPPDEQNIAWHGRDNYDFLQPEVDDPVVLTEKWDGCTYVPEIQGLFGPNVDGLGYVDQVLSVRDPLNELQELFCRQTPGPRAYHSMIIHEDKLYILGGKQSEKVFHADAWYRDSKLPTASFGKIPKKRDTFPWFHFNVDEEGAYFEYRVWDPNRYKELRPWTKVTKKTDIGWLDWRMGGPGNGRYQLYVRAVDPAGNRDARYVMGQNVRNWYYLSPIPWDIILGTIFGFLFLCFLAYLEYRRRVKKAAMERYAMKRMRRKFKAMQRDINGRSVDWRTLYLESKQNEEAGLTDKKKKKKARDKNAEKREKERKKREKEKEMIKKKLQASKDHKEKLKLEKDKEATMDLQPIKKLTNKKNKVAPGSGEKDDDSDLGLEDVLLKDEEEKAGREGRPGAVRVKAKPNAKGNTGMVVAGDGNDGTDTGIGDSPLAVVRQKETTKAVKTPIKDTTVAIAADSSKEVGAGKLKASADTETGTKQRRVNKQLKEYDGGAGEDVEHKKNS